jgi:hypothetical protein
MTKSIPIFQARASVSFSMIPDADGKPESSKVDPEELARLLAIELAQKRAAWAGAEARHRNIRMVSFFFLAIVIMGALVGFFFIFTSLTQNRVSPEPRPTATSSPSP